jgi:hypothetical protein
LITIGVTITGKPLPPWTLLFALVNEYVQEDRRLIVPPPAALAALIAATRSLAEHGTGVATADDENPDNEAAATAKEPQSAAVRPLNRRDRIICPS